MTKSNTILLLFIFLVFSYQPKNIVYEIITSEKGDQGLVNQLFVFTKNMSDIKEINTLLFIKYKSTGVATLQIYYFDNKIAAKNYKQFLFDKNVSDKKLDKLRKHVIGKFEYTAFDNKQSLNIGKGADDY